MHDIIHQHVVNVTVVMLTILGWEAMNHSLYSPGLAWSDCNLFGLMRVHLGGQKFQTDNELEHCVLKWLHSQDKTLYAAVIGNFPGQWKKMC
jgi:hypothetical protein